MPNLIKETCKALGITQKELAEKMGVAEGTVNRWASKPDEITEQAQKTLQLLLENNSLKANAGKVKTLFNLIEEIKNTQNDSF